MAAFWRLYMWIYTAAILMATGGDLPRSTPLEDPKSSDRSERRNDVFFTNKILRVISVVIHISHILMIYGYCNFCTCLCK